MRPYSPSKFIVPGLLFAISFALYMFSGQHPLWDIEAMYAEVPRETALSGNIFYPTLNFAPFLFKPPLYQWANAAAMALFGHGMAALRLPTALFSAGTVVFTYLIASKASRRAGVYAGAIAATMYGITWHSAFLYIDIPLTFFTTASIFFLLEAAEGKKYAMPMLWLSLAMSIMTKGFIGTVFSGIAIAFFIIKERRWELAKGLFNFKWILLFLAVVVPWHIAMEAHNPGFLYSYIIDEQVLRFFNKRFPPDYDSVSSPVFVLVTFGWLFPWSAFVLQSVGQAFKDRRPVVQAPLLLGLGGMAFLTLSSSKMEYYSLPLLPAFATVTGCYWDRMGSPESGSRTKDLAGLFILAAAAAAIAISSGPQAASLGESAQLPSYILKDLGRIAAYSLSTIFAGSVLTAAFIIKKRYQAAFVSFVGAAFIFSLLANGSIRPLTGLFSSHEAAAEVAALAGPNDLIITDGQEEYEYSSIFSFYSGHKVSVLKNNGKPEVSDNIGRATRFIIGDAEFKAIWLSGRTAYFATSRDAAVGEIAGIPSARFKEVFKGPTRVYTNKI